MRQRLIAIATLTLLISAFGCGKKGALYLPPPAQTPPAATTSP